jgi:DNA-binding transcriptional regulator YiaG
MDGQVAAHAAVYAPTVNVYGGGRWTSSAAGSIPATSFLSASIYSPPELSIRATSPMVNTPDLVLVVNNSPRNLNGSIVAVKTERKQSPDYAPATSFKQDLERVQMKFGLSITQLAELLGVTRKSVYDWFDGTDPRNAKNRNRMGAILALLDSRPDFDLTRLKGVWNMPVSGVSFLSILGNEDVPESDRLPALAEKLEQLAPRLGAPVATRKGAYLGESHASELDRMSDIG